MPCKALNMLPVTEVNNQEWVEWVLLYLGLIGTGILDDDGVRDLKRGSVKLVFHAGQWGYENLARVALKGSSHF